jgi:hypothetical protein
MLISDQSLPAAKGPACCGNTAWLAPVKYILRKLESAERNIFLQAATKPREVALRQRYAFFFSKFSLSRKLLQLHAKRRSFRKLCLIEHILK